MSMMMTKLDGTSVINTEHPKYNLSIYRSNKYFNYIFPKLRTFDNKRIKRWRVVINDPNKISNAEYTTTLGYFSVKQWKDIEDIIFKNFDKYDSDISIDPCNTEYNDPTILITLLRRKY